MEAWNRVVLAASALHALVGAACGCPDDEVVTTDREVDLGSWRQKTAVSGTSGETHSYLHLPSQSQYAPAMVLLPGLLFDSRIFVHLEELAERFELFAWNYPEDSPHYTGDQLDLPRLLDDFVATVGIERFVLLGNSLGGFVAMQYFRVEDHRPVDALILVSAQMFDATERDRRRRERMARFMSKRSDEFLLCAIKRMVLRARRHETGPGPENGVFDIFEMKDVAFYREVIGFMGSYDGESGKDLVEAPVLVLHGSEDQLIDVEKTSHTLEFLPQADLVVVEGVAHEGPFSHGDVFSKEILDWYAETLGASSP
jgi:pimeloyl-ACP methyl ester carboxylesterase